MSKGGPAEIILETVDSLKGEKDDYATSESESEMVGGKGKDAQNLSSKLEP